MTKSEIVAAIAHRLGFTPPPMSRGSTEPRLLFTMALDRLGIATGATTKHDLARAIVESAGHDWRSAFESAGGTVTLRGLRAVLDAVTALTPDPTLRPRFHVAPTLPASGPPNAMLLVSDDWGSDNAPSAAYNLYYSDTRGSLRFMGSVNIARRYTSSHRNTSSARPPASFQRLTDDFFSLGHDADYYNRVSGLGRAVGPYVLDALRDLALSNDLYRQVISEPALKRAVMTNVPQRAVLDQFRRIAQGGAKLTPYTLSFEWTGRSPGPSIQIDFRVVPHSMPPTNMHAIIGRNGAGKTRLLQAIAHVAAQGSAYSDDYIESASWRETTTSQTDQTPPFTTVVHSSFSAFDQIEPPPEDTRAIPYVSIGLPFSGTSAPSDSATIITQLSRSIEACVHGDRLQRWRRGIRVLESDPIFAETGLSSILTGLDEGTAAMRELVRNRVLEIFSSMSSGHKSALLAITQLVENVEERSLVLLDEPESHLHPPLLASFLRALTDLLTDRNGVGIVATHSPVVLQEVSRTCVTVLRRSGIHQAVGNPRIETFGENVSTLTREVFGLELSRSGFYQMILNEIDGEMTFADLEAAFGGNLGSEARATAFAAIAQRGADK